MQETPFPNDPRLAPWLALAALFHAAVILLLPVERAATAPTPRLTVALAQPSAAPTPAAPARPARASPPPAPAVAPSSAPLPPAAALSAEHAATSGEASARVIAQVRSALARHFVYPLAARRQGWQGEVLIAFLITREGRIDHVEVVRSSGYRLLDEAARSSLARVGTLPEYAARDGEPLRIRMPVVYRLEG